MWPSNIYLGPVLLLLVVLVCRSSSIPQHRKADKVPLEGDSPLPQVMGGSSRHRRQADGDASVPLFENELSNTIIPPASPSPTMGPDSDLAVTEPAELEITTIGGGEVSTQPVMPTTQPEEEVSTYAPTNIVDNSTPTNSAVGFTLTLPTTSFDEDNVIESKEGTQSITSSPSPVPETPTEETMLISDDFTTASMSTFRPEISTATGMETLPHATEVFSTQGTSTEHENPRTESTFPTAHETTAQTLSGNEDESATLLSVTEILMKDITTQTNPMPTAPKPTSAEAKSVSDPQPTPMTSVTQSSASADETTITTIPNRDIADSPVTESKEPDSLTTLKVPVTSSPGSVTEKASEKPDTGNANQPITEPSQSTSSSTTEMITTPMFSPVSSAPSASSLQPDRPESRVSPPLWPLPTPAPRPPTSSSPTHHQIAHYPLLLPTKERPIAQESTTETCDFGTNEDVVLCTWMNVNVTSLKWRASRGENAYWMGGPTEDVTYGDKFGGYAVFETSEEPDTSRGPVAFESAMLISPLQGSTGAEGVCVKYWYSIGGLSADRVRVLLHPMPQAKYIKPKPGANEGPDATTSPTGEDAQCEPPYPTDRNYDTFLHLLRDYDGSGDVVLWEARDVTQGEWKEGQIVYTYNMPHAIIVEGIPVSHGDFNRRFRGYIAIDELNFAEPSECGAFCTFEAGTCGWVQDEETDDFDWSLSRGSLSQSTGPPRDRSASENGGMTGGFAVIDSSYPRRPGDRARLMTEEFQATDPDSPLCMRFWTHMHGVGIGTLRVLIINTQDRKSQTIWEISGEAGKIWYQGQVPISSSTPFKIAFEGEVGLTNLGDIALDDISIIQGPCPSAPQVAGNNLGDCTFEVDECGWINPGIRDRLDEIDWIRTIASENREPKTDHTIGTPQGFFMIVPKSAVQRGGDRAWLRSTPMKGSPEVMCVSFWYYISDPTSEPSAPSLGSLTVYMWTENQQDGTTIFMPIWSLMNHQGPNWLYAQAKLQSDTDYAIIFEGTWGHSRGNGFIGLDDITIFMGDCTTMPPKATVMNGDCDFQRDSCRWINTTTDPDFRWSSASIARRPTSLPDHTFGGPLGYVFFDVFNQNANPQTLRLTSPTLEGENICFTFWYASFGSGSATSLTVLQVLPDGDETTGEELWKVEVAGGVQPRPDWRFAQTPVIASNQFRVSFAGMASNGGFAIDDIKVYPGTCTTRPKEADPNYIPEEDFNSPRSANSERAP